MKETRWPFEMFVGLFMCGMGVLYLPLMQTGIIIFIVVGYLHRHQR